MDITFDPSKNATNIAKHDVSLADAEDVRINAGIAADPDNPEWTAEGFARAKMGVSTPAPGKASVTIRLDNEVLEVFKARAAEQGKGYQTLINDTLRAAVFKGAEPVTEDILRRILREELHQT